jgi:ribulose 1,5-bisphosphate synthetase/thiazole synthase
MASSSKALTAAMCLARTGARVVVPETLVPSGGVARYTPGSGERSLVTVSGHRQR